MVASAIVATAVSNTSLVAADGSRMPLILRTYCRAPASISAAVADGSSPRRIVMFLHIGQLCPASLLASILVVLLSITSSACKRRLTML